MGGSTERLRIVENIYKKSNILKGFNSGTHYKLSQEYRLA
jgi:hypothetical protein